MKISITVLSICILTCYSISGQQSVDKKPKITKHCKKGTKLAASDWKDDQLKYLFLYNPYILSRFNLGPPRYEQELSELLHTHSIEYSIEFYAKNKRYNFLHCYKQYMDSAITAKYGPEFITDIKEQADSLFASKYKEKIYSTYELDESPRILKVKYDSTLMSLFPLIIYLNSQLEDTSTYKFVPNNPDISYNIEFEVDTLGKASNCVITNRSYRRILSEDKLKAIENKVIALVNASDNWTPAKIRNQIVTCRNRETIGIAIKKVTITR